MFSKTIKIVSLIFILSSCSGPKEEFIYKPTQKQDPYLLYNEGLDAFKKSDFFYASKKFEESELNFENIELAAKSAIMSAYSLYSINFYDEALESLNRYLKNYPADKNIMYAHYLIAVIYFEQISDEKKDMQPLVNADKKIDYFLKNYSRTDYAVDLKFKKNLIQNQLAAKELFVAKYYISIKKWVPAINRLKIIIDKYDSTIFIEEALHRLVEIHYHLGLEDEATNYAKILGYNYNSSEWFQESYKILNKDYKLELEKVSSKQNDVESQNILDKIFNILK